MDDYVPRRLKDLCTSAGKSYYQLAHEAGMSTSSLYSILQGKTSPRVSTLTELCKPFGISLESFFAENIIGDKDKQRLSEMEEKIKKLTPRNKVLLENILDLLVTYQND